MLYNRREIVLYFYPVQYKFLLIDDKIPNQEFRCSTMRFTTLPQHAVMKQDVSRCTVLDLSIGTGGPEQTALTQINRHKPRRPIISVYANHQEVFETNIQILEWKWSPFRISMIKC